MNIIQVCAGLGRSTRGAERFCLDLSERLSSQGHNVTLIIGGNISSELMAFSFRVETIPEVRKKILRKTIFDYINPSALFKFSGLISRLQPDVVHLHSLYGISSSLVWASARRVPTVVTFHDMWPVYYDPPLVSPKLNLANTYWKVPLGWGHRVVNRCCFRKAHIITPAKWLIDYSRNTGLLNSMTHIPPAVELSNIPGKYEKEILWVGAITEGKGLAKVLPTLIEIGKSRGWKVTILGDGPGKRVLEKKYPYADFLGTVDPKRFYQRSSLLVVSSTQPETGPLVLLEGMANGLCVIGHSVNGVREIVSHNIDGLLYSSLAELEDQLKSIVMDRARIKAIGRAAVAKVERDYLWGKCVERHLDIYTAHALYK